jgi:hypothetical protein
MSMVSLREHLKLLHFQTTKYAIHKASDDFLSTYDELFDKFWETAQSNKYRVILSTENLELSNIKTYNDLEPLLNKVTELLDSVAESYLVAVRDELLSEINQFAYLMTFS